MALLVGLLWLLEAIDQASGNALDAYGIQPRSGEGLFEVFTAPFLHGGWAHLAANTVPFFVLGVIVLLDGWRQLAHRHAVGRASPPAPPSGCISPAGSVTLGASGVVFGWLTYLIVRGLYTRAPGQIALGVVRVPVLRRPAAGACSPPTAASPGRPTSAARSAACSPPAGSDGARSTPGWD